MPTSDAAAETQSLLAYVRARMAEASGATPLERVKFAIAAFDEADRAQREYSLAEPQRKAACDVEAFNAQHIRRGMAKPLRMLGFDSTKEECRLVMRKDTLRALFSSLAEPLIRVARDRGMADESEPLRAFCENVTGWDSEDSRRKIIGALNKLNDKLGANGTGGNGAEELGPPQKRKKRGRPRKYDAAADRRLHEAWGTRRYPTMEALAQTKNMPVTEVRKALERHRNKLNNRRVR